MDVLFKNWDAVQFDTRRTPVDAPPTPEGLPWEEKRDRVCEDNYVQVVCVEKFPIRPEGVDSHNGRGQGNFFPSTCHHGCDGKATKRGTSFDCHIRSFNYRQCA
jgi:hypothetical protein